MCYFLLLFEQCYYCLRVRVIWLESSAIPFPHHGLKVDFVSKAADHVYLVYYQVQQKAKKLAKPTELLKATCLWFYVDLLVFFQVPT